MLSKKGKLIVGAVIAIAVIAAVVMFSGMGEYLVQLRQNTLRVVSMSVLDSLCTKLMIVPIEPLFCRLRPIWLRLRPPITTA